MIRFTWLQFRTQAVVALGALVIAAVVLAVTGLNLAHVYDTTIASCKQRGDCAAALSTFPSRTDITLYNFWRILLYAVPVLTGMFWGAPLVARELETGTYRLAWTQGVTRGRWLAIKIGVVGAASLVLTGLLSLMLTWWSSPIQNVDMDRLTPAVFGASGIAPVGYAAFAFALGVTAGALVRRTLPAIAITLVVFAAVQGVTPLWVRPHLIEPVQTASALNTASLTSTGSDNGQLMVGASVNVPGAWILSNQIITPAGRPASTEPPQACGQNVPIQACDAYIASLHLRQIVSYQPASRYWPLQWYETAIFTALALILAGLSYWPISRRLSQGLSIRPHRTTQKPLALERST
jgi:hypothetical protein